MPRLQDTKPTAPCRPRKPTKSINPEHGRSSAYCKRNPSCHTHWSSCSNNSIRARDGERIYGYIQSLKGSQLRGSTVRTITKRYRTAPIRLPTRVERDGRRPALRLSLPLRLCLLPNRNKDRLQRLISKDRDRQKQSKSGYYEGFRR